MPQDRVASWVGITQAQLSRIETGPPLAHLDRLIQWATVLRIPAERLWFRLPTAATDTGGEREGDQVRRRTFLTAAGLGMTGALVTSPSPAGLSVNGQEATEWLAWHLWQQRTRELHRSQIPAHIAAQLDAHPHVIHHPDRGYAFTDPALIDVLVAQRVFGDIATGKGHLLATAQTSHATDLMISALAANDEGARRGLSAWMRRGPTAVLRVNAAGVLAKVGNLDFGDAAIAAIRDDPDARHLYLTAVASRVLASPWDEAGRLAAHVRSPTANPAGRFEDATASWVADRLAAELANPRDCAARWCSAALLSSLAGPLSEQVRAALARAARHEPCRENLRAYAAVLAGTSPIVA